MFYTNGNPWSCCSKKPKVRALGFWYNRLWNIAISSFKIEGKEFDGAKATMNRQYLLWKLFTFGFAGITRDPKGKIRGLDCTRIGYDPYMYPTNLNFVNEKLGSFSRKVNDTAVYMMANKNAAPVIPVIKKYAEQLADIDITLMVNVKNIRTTHIFTANSDPEAQQIRQMVSDIEDGLPATLKKSTLRETVLAGKNGLPVYSIAENYFADKMIQDTRSKLSEFLNIFGIDSSGANQVKAERNLVSEVHSNDQEIEVNRRFWIDPMQEAFDKCKDLFGVDWKIDVVRREEIDVRRISTEESAAGASELASEG